MQIVKNKFFFSLVFMLCVVPAMGSEVYKWVDEDGNVHYGDKAKIPNPEKASKLSIRDKYSVPRVDKESAIAYQGSEPNRPISLSELLMDIDGYEHGKVLIGRQTCGRPVNLYWDSSSRKVSSGEVDHAVVSVFEDFGYTAQSALNGSPSKTHLHLKATIKFIKINTCPDQTSSKLSKNATYVRVLWELIDPLKQKTLYQNEVKGSHHSLNKPPVRDGDDVSLNAAISMATNNLLADENFVKLIKPGEVNDLVKNFNEPIEVMLSYGNGVGMFVSKASQLKDQSVVIETESGHGSGVIVNAEGYILTNAHVVNDQETVKVSYANEVLRARVIRVEPYRDVAILKVDSGRRDFNGVFLANSAPNVGETVYVIGTPLSLNNSQTITQGIVSAMRTVGGIPYIQTDASVNAGNSGGPVFNSSGELVALTVAGTFTAGGANLSINYLIPIDDAIKRLNVYTKKQRHENVLLDDLVYASDEQDMHPFREGFVKIYDWLNSPLF